MKQHYRKQELVHLYSGLTFDRSDIVLDAMCGDGFATKPLLKKVGDAVGVDIAPKPEDYQGTYVQRDISTIPLDIKFTKILANTGFHHLGEKQRETIYHLEHMLYVHGVLRIADLASDSPASALQDEYVPGHGRACHWVNEKKLSAMLESVRLTEIETDTSIISWTFETDDELEAVVAQTFRTTPSVLERNGILSVPLRSVLLPFVYATGVKA